MLHELIFDNFDVFALRSSTGALSLGTFTNSAFRRTVMGLEHTNVNSTTTACAT